MTALQVGDQRQIRLTIDSYWPLIYPTINDLMNILYSCQEVPWYETHNEGRLRPAGYA